MISRHNYLALKVPDERDIIDIPGKPRVGMAVKKELAGHRHYSTSLNTPRVICKHA
jgi:hypothetical protein